jgi:hypothetical protein
MVIRAHEPKPRRYKWAGCYSRMLRRNGSAFRATGWTNARGSFVRAQPSPKRRLIKLAPSEREHSADLGGTIAFRDQSVPALRLSHRTRITAGLARRLGVKFVVPNFAARDLSAAYCDHANDRTMDYMDTSPGK